jgi:hypothetical protein
MNSTGITCIERTAQTSCRKVQCVQITCSWKLCGFIGLYVLSHVVRRHRDRDAAQAVSRRRLTAEDQVSFHHVSLGFCGGHCDTRTRFSLESFCSLLSVPFHHCPIITRVLSGRWTMDALAAAVRQT